MPNSNSTTSEHFCCNSCGVPVAIELINADDLVYQCQNRRCRRAVSVDTPQGLQVCEALESPARLIAQTQICMNVTALVA